MGVGRTAAEADWNDCATTVVELGLGLVAAQGPGGGSQTVGLGGGSVAADSRLAPAGANQAVHVQVQREWIRLILLEGPARVRSREVRNRLGRRQNKTGPRWY